MRRQELQKQAAEDGLLLQRLRNEVARIIQHDGELLAEFVLYRPQEVFRDLGVELVRCESDEVLAIVGDCPEHVHLLTSARDR